MDIYGASVGSWPLHVTAPAMLSCAAFATGRDGRDMAKSAACPVMAAYHVICHDISTYHSNSLDMTDKTLINCCMLDC